MDLFRKQKEFIETFPLTIAIEMEATISSFGFVLKDYVVNKQLFREGIDGDGQKLEGYKRTTIRLKLRKGQPVDRTTLHDEEEFVESIQIDAFSDRFEISSGVDYDKYILKRYGRNVLKITNENFREFMVNYFINNLKQKIDGRFTK